MRKRQLAGAACLALVALVATLGGLTHLAIAQDPPPVLAPADGRLWALPFLGGRSATEQPGCWVPGPDCAPGGARPVLNAAAQHRWLNLSGVRVQNAGGRPTRLMLAYLSDATDPGCATCQVAALRCSPELGPGETWTFPGVITHTAGTTATVGAHAVVYSLNTQPARDYGPEFTRYLEETRQPPDTSLATLACAELTPTAPECATYLGWQSAFAQGGMLPFAPTLPAAPFRGEAVAAVSASPIEVLAVPGSGPELTVDRTSALAWPDSETAAGPFEYFAPGAYLAPPDGFGSTLVVQNLGAECATVTVTAFQTSRGPVEGGAAELVIPAGGRQALDAGQRWPQPTGATLRLQSDQPLAVLLLNRSPATSSLSPALAARAEPVTWALPLAYQESRPGPFRLRSPATIASRPMAAGAWRGAAQPSGAAPARLQADEGFGSYISAFNPITQTRNVSIRTQAPGLPAREILYPLAGRAQTVFQLGFGLGLPGGPGWGSLRVAGPNAYVTNETLRSASDLRVAYLEAWMAPAWAFSPDAPAPRTVLLPDLGGPAVGATGIAGLRPGTGVTHTLVAQLAVQNLITATARVAIDSFASCGYAGTVTQEIDPRQAAWLPAVGLAGTVFGANAARLRVLEGSVAVQTDLVRPERQSTADYWPDFSSAWLGQPFAHELPAPAVAVTPTEVTIQLPTAPDDDAPFVTVLPVHVSQVCARVTVTSDRPWLSGEAGSGSIPGGVSVWVATDKLGPGRRHVGHLTLASDPPGTNGLPATVTVTVLGKVRPDPLYLPWTMKTRR